MASSRVRASWLAALVVCAAAVTPAACSSSAAVYDCAVNYVRVKGSGQDESLNSCAGVVGIQGLAPVRLRRNHSVRVVVPDGLAVTLSTGGSDVVTIDGLRITARKAGTATITQTGLTCTNQTLRCRLVQVIVR